MRLSRIGAVIELVAKAIWNDAFVETGLR